MRNAKIMVGLSLCLSLSTGSSLAQKKATDIRPNHWATQAVQQALNNGVLGFTDGTNFRGEAKVTRTQAVVALAKLAQSLETRKWKAQKSSALPVKTEAMQVVDSTQPVTRYTLALSLSHFGNYLMNGLPRLNPNGKDIAKSEVLPAPPRLTIPTTHPAYKSLEYLAKKRMITPSSPLLKPDNTPLKSMELSQGLAEMATGLTNLWTELGKEEDGSTPDRSFRNRPKP